MIYFFTFFALFLVIELVYFKIADHFHIIDQPNHRSSHSSITIRGGGILFPVSVLVYTVLNGFQYIYFVTGLLAIATVSFLDDILTLNNKVRLCVHLSSVLLLFFQWNLFSLGWHWIFIALIFVIATINAYNFMDGINGITGSYSLLTIATLYYINQYILNFTSSELLLITGISLIVFNFFNFRTKAKCFAGDVGSVSIAFIIVFVIGQLILATSNLSYILLLLVYGLDTFTTVIFRLLRRENIFEAHRSHLYQYLCNQSKKPHLFVSACYMLIQLLINVIIICFGDKVSNLTLPLILIVSIFTFIAIRWKVEGKDYLVHRKFPDC